MSIGKRLTIGILIIILVSTGANFIGIWNLQRAKDSVSQIYTNATQPISVAANLSAAFLTLRVSLYQISSTDDQVSIPVIQQKIVEEKQACVDGIAQLKPLITDKKGQDYMAEIESSFHEFQFSADSAVEMVVAGNKPAAEMKVKFELALLGDTIYNDLSEITKNQVAFAAGLYDTTNKSATANTISMIALALIVLVGSVVFGLLIARSISAPLMRATQLAQTIAGGDLTVQVDQKFLKRTDEVGQLSSSMSGMVETLRGSMAAVSNAESEVGNTSRQLDDRVENEVGEVNRISQNVEQVSNLVGNLIASVTETSSTVNAIVGNLEKLNELIEAQSANVTQSSSSIEEMIGNNNSIAGNVQLMSQAFGSLESASATGQQRINETVSTIQKVAEQSARLQEANQVINAIAAQTNLLAMNAAIEAAHAGDAGSGFAVVADEIRNLASKAASQSKEISSDIKTIRESIKLVTDSSHQTETAFKGIMEQIGVLGHYEHEITSAMSEQSSGSQQILEATMQINDITVNVRDASTEMLGGSQAIVAEMDGLQRITESVSGRMQEISAGAESIKSSLAEIRVISQRSAALALALSEQVARFKL